MTGDAPTSSFVQRLLQAFAQLGAAIRTPRHAACSQCPPPGDECRAKGFVIQESLPLRHNRKTLPHHDIAAGVIWCDGRILIARRSPRGLFGGLWEFPGGKREPGESLEECLAREVREELGIVIHVGEQLATVKHAYTHFRITLHVYHCRHVSGEPRAIGCTAWKWITPRDLFDYAFPAANRAIIAALQRGDCARSGAQ